MRNLIRLIPICLLGLSFLFPGCGGSDDGSPTNPPPVVDLSGVQLSVAGSVPTGKIFVSGLPSGKAVATYDVVFLDATGLDLFTLPLEVPTEGLPWFQAPFHPVTPADGGLISLLVASGPARSPQQSLELGALPTAVGSFARYVALLQEHVDQRAQRAGSSFAALTELAADEVPPALLPLKFAQLFVDDPDNPNCLARIADGSSDYLDPMELDLLDRTIGFAPLDSLVQADIDLMAGSPGRVFDWSGDSALKEGCVNMGPTVATAQDLSEAMQTALEAAVATDPNGAPAQILSATGLALGAAALVPALGAVTAVAGAGLYAYQTSREYYANTYPSSFVSLDFDLDQATMPEDEPGFVQWSNVQVIAKSKGWVADKAIFDAVMQMVGAGLGLAQVNKIAGSESLASAAMTGAGLGVGSVLDGQPGGAVEFCSQRWGVDITDLPYSRGEAVIGRVSVDTSFRQIRPAQVGQDVIRVQAVAERFGFQHASAEKPIETKAIQVVATPAVINVKDPGEVVNISVTVENADKKNLEWRAEAGTWNDGLGNETNEPGTRPLETPLSEDAYPFLVVIESMSRQGLRAGGDPIRVDIVTIKHEPGEVIVTPAGECVINGKTRTFSAEVQGVDNQAVTWSLEPEFPGGGVLGSISQGGVYTAPGSGSGTVLVVATSQEDDTLVGRVPVEVGSCACSWALTIDGDGGWTGKFASHAFPGAFSPFSMTFGPLDSTQPGAGVIQVFGGEPASGQTGSWGCNFNWQIGNRAWVAVDDELTPATLTVLTNTGSQLNSTVIGTVVTDINGEASYRGFQLTIRSGDLFGGADSICGE